MTSIETLFHKTIDEAASRQAQSIITKQTAKDEYDQLLERAKAHAAPLREMFALIKALPSSENTSFSILEVSERPYCKNNTPYARFNCHIEGYEGNHKTSKPRHESTQPFYDILVAPDGEAKLVTHVDKIENGAKKDAEDVVGGSIEVIAGLFLKGLIAKKALNIDSQVETKFRELRLIATRDNAPIIGQNGSPTNNFGCGK